MNTATYPLAICDWEKFITDECSTPRVLIHLRELEFWRICRDAQVQKPKDDSPTKRSKEGFVGADLFSKLFRNLSLPRPGPKRRLNLTGVVQRNHSWKIIPKTVISIAIVAWVELAKLDNL